mgnify:CR=1 FL=1
MSHEYVPEIATDRDGNQHEVQGWQDDFYGDYTEDQKYGPMAGSFEWIDREGQKAHQDRMSNGFRLFGTYFENLWD